MGKSNSQSNDPVLVPGTVLIVDDDVAGRKSLEDALQIVLPNAKFFSVGTEKEALQRLRDFPIDVAVVDLCLESGEEGYELLLRMKNAKPQVQVVVLTAYATIGSAVRCMRSGCLDYMQKPPHVRLLAGQVGRGIELSRSRMQRDRSIESMILANWEMANFADAGDRKGYYLEALAGHLLSTVPGWYVKSNITSATEEIDLVVRNESPDVFWREYGTIILVECKNLKGRASREQFDAFFQKISRRGLQHCRLGFFLSLSGVGAPFATVAADTKTGIAVVPMGGPDIWQLICAADRSAWLKDRVQDQFFQ